MSIAHELGLDLHEWYVKSTSRARDGLYVIDMVRRLQDANMEVSKAQKLTPYIRFGPLGEALRSNTESVVLIDEIDKADIDFPNDLLRELDQKKFTIEELDEAELTQNDRAKGFQKTYSSEQTPIVVITSNDEKELPDAFLRRCLFHYIEFPTPGRLKQIVRVNLPDLDLEDRLLHLATKQLGQIRTIKGYRKAPATSELIDWMQVLHHWGVTVEAMEAADTFTDLPYWEVLFKHQQDRQLVERNAKEQANATEEVVT